MGPSPVRPRRKNRVAAEVRATADFTGAFGAFRFIERIERGGPAELYRAYWAGAPSGEERSCLIKRLRPELADSPAFQQMFADEARTMLALDHPNIVRVYTHGVIDGLPYLALEPLDGWSLQHLLASLRHSGTKLPIEVAAFIAREVASALGHAHEACDHTGKRLGVVHRDVRPANIMLLRTGAVKLVDFGVARVASFVSHNLNVNTAPGKPSYLSPEHLVGGTLDGRADLFALGAVLWELLVGQPLFPPGSPEELQSRLEKQPVASPASVRPQVPAALDALVMRLLARPLAERAASAAEISVELGAFVPADRDATRAIGSMVRTGLGRGAELSPPGAKRSLSRFLPPIRALLARAAGSGGGNSGRRPTAVVALDAVRGLRSKLFRAGTNTPTSEATPPPPPPETTPPTPAPPESTSLPLRRPPLWSLPTRVWAPRTRLVGLQVLTVAAVAFAAGVLWYSPRLPSVTVSATTVARAHAGEPLAGVVIEPLTAPPAAPMAAGVAMPTAEPTPVQPVVKAAKPAKRRPLPARKRRALHRR